ncbi:GNAT family N-acetyltransferase [Streptomyces californicus]|uniref:GNAT family N-acetyltransferase n=1 Tax=Streptomyces californicus TaxID=67351 RepID=UPI0037A6F258
MSGSPLTPQTTDTRDVHMGRIKPSKGETSGVRPARPGEGSAVRELLTEVVRDDQDRELLEGYCKLLDHGVDLPRRADGRILVFERRRTPLAAALVTGGHHGLEPGSQLAELAHHQNLYAQQAGMQQRMFARINAVCAHLAFMAVAPNFRGQGLGRQLVDAAADIERRRGRRILTAYVWGDGLTDMYEKWGFIVSPPETAMFFLREKVTKRLHAPSLVGLNQKKGSRMVILPLVPDVRTHDVGTDEHPLPAVVGVEEPFQPAHLDLPQELAEIKSHVEDLVRQQTAFYGPEHVRSVFDAFLSSGAQGTSDPAGPNRPVRESRTGPSRAGDRDLQSRPGELQECPHGPTVR